MVDLHSLGASIALILVLGVVALAITSVFIVNAAVRRPATSYIPEDDAAFVAAHRSAMARFDTDPASFLHDELFGGSDDLHETSFADPFESSHEDDASVHPLHDYTMAMGDVDSTTAAFPESAP